MPKITRPFENDFRRSAKSKDVFRQPKDMTRHEKIEGERKERLKRWITFFRRNPHRFIEQYFGITIYPYQILMIWVLQKSNLAYIVAARAAAKTFIIAVWALTLGVLYPGLQIIVCAKTLKQGGIIISEKIAMLRERYPNVAREIRSLTHNVNTYSCVLHNGSTINVVPSAESSRGNRASYIIVEESRLVPKDILEGIIKPFLFSRMPPYRSKPEYAEIEALKEEGTISYITSAWYKSEYWYSYVRSCIKRMVGGDETANFLAFDYNITIRHNIKTEEMIKNEMIDADPVTVQMEYFNIPSGTSGKAYFKPSMFKRNIKRAFYPQREITYNTRRNPYNTPKVEGEIRMISIDVATRANKTNDLSIISCARLIPMMGRGYERSLMYMESFKGRNTVLQAKRIKEVFFDFEADYLVLDLMNAGISIFDSLSQVTKHDERGLDYPAMTIVSEEFEIIDNKLREDLTNRTIGLGAIEVVFPILATQNLNSQIAVAFRSSLQKKLWNFLIPDAEAEEFLIKSNKEFMADANDSETTVFFLNPYVQTNLLIGECINLDMALSGGLIKLVEKPGLYKDRFSSVSYMNWIINHFDQELLKDPLEIDVGQEVMNIMMVF